MSKYLKINVMKRFFQLIVLLMVIGISAANAQERHYSYRYAGTTYKATGGGQTAMENKASSCVLKSEFIASILPDHKTIWLYSSAINERCMGKGVYTDGGYSYNAPLSDVDIYNMVIGGAISVGDYSIFLKSDHSRITCITTEEKGGYSVIRYDHYNRISTVSAPKNSKRAEFERQEAVRKSTAARVDKEQAEQQAQRDREHKAYMAKLESSIGKEFPMAYFVDSHGNRISSSYFKRGKKTLVITYMVGCIPNHELRKVVNGYPQLASQIVNIYLSQTSYSDRKKDTSTPVRTDRIYFNPDEGENSNWIYGDTYPCIILLDEYGKVLSYKFGFDKEKDRGYIMDIIAKLSGRKSGTGAPYQVGDYYNDGKSEGIVFEVYNNGYSGKIVSLKHSDKILKWRERGTLNIGKTFGVADGEDIMRYRNLAEDISGADAFGWCRRLGVGWYLPTIDELKSIYANRAVIEPKLSDKLARYWSSTEYSADKAYYIEKGAGVVWSSEKYYGCKVRAVKCFGNVPRQEQKSTSAPYKVGDFYNENGKTGIVFEVNSDGTSGKIYTISPVSEARWVSDRSEADNLVGANDHNDGANNLASVMRIPDWQRKYPAFAACAKLGKGWYLPAKGELDKIVENSGHCVIPIRVIDDVWSSTEHFDPDKVGAWSKGYYTNYGRVKSSLTNKYNQCKVYAVTRFGESENSGNISYEQSRSPYKVGDLYNEDGKLGVVVETWDSGRSGKIVSLATLRTTESEAESYCKSLGEGWRLPTVDELRLLSYDKAQYKAIESCFERYGSQFGGCYWSSVKSGKMVLEKYPTAYVVDSDGAYTQQPICYNYPVRAIAEFGTTQRPKTTLARERTAAPYKVGDYYNDGTKDGVVFEVSADGQHGKIVSINNSIIELKWYSGRYDDNYAERYVGAKNKKDGKKNMQAICAVDSWRELYPAFRWCADLGEDWYLPAIEELEVIYNNKAQVLPKLLNDKNNCLHSSTESNKYKKDDVWSSRDKHKTILYINMQTGNIDKTYKDYSYHTRAVAKF